MIRRIAVSRIDKHSDHIHISRGIPLKRALYALAVLVLLAGVATTASAQDLSSITTQLGTPSGEQTTVAKLGQGKVTVVSFWATWCVPCKKEMQAMQPVYERLKGQGLEYIAVSVDNTKTMSRVGSYISSKGYTFPVLLDPNQDLFKSLNGTDVPFTLLFNADGSFHSRHEGYLEGDEAKMETELVKMLAAKSGGASAPQGH
jgi:cytochrome c biogenesis protein CcmG, thiol:disulfide interchange protein DsbE